MESDNGRYVDLMDVIRDQEYWDEQTKDYDKNAEFRDLESGDKPFRFEYAHESLTESFSRYKKRNSYA